MAIKNNFSKENISNSYKFDFPNVYYKIDQCDVDANNENIRIGVRGYPDEYSRLNNGIGIYKKIFNIKFSDLIISDFSKNSILESCYVWLSSQDEFENGIKC
jgi:hypothetical protein